MLAHYLVKLDVSKKQAINDKLQGIVATYSVFKLRWGC